MSSETQDVERVVRSFGEFWNRHDMDAFARLFAADAQFVNVVGLWWKGRDEIKGAHAATHATLFRNSTLDVREVAVRILKPDVAIARTPWRLTGHVGPSGEKLPERKGILVTVMMREGAEWKIVDAQNTDIVEGVLAPPQ